MNDKPPEYDREAVIERLLLEVRSLHTVLNSIELELSRDERTRGLTVIGGVEALRKARDTAEATVRSLNKELDLMIKKSK